MTDSAYQLLETIEPTAAAPWVRRLWFAPATGIHVQTRTVRISARLGRISWRITASLAGADGKALRLPDGAPIVLERSHNFVARAEQAGEWTSEERARALLEDYDREHRFIVARVEAAAPSLVQSLFAIL